MDRKGIHYLCRQTPEVSLLGPPLIIRHLPKNQLVVNRNFLDTKVSVVTPLVPESCYHTRPISFVHKDITLNLI